MNLSERIATLSAWGKAIEQLTSEEKELLIEKTGNKNRWFTPDSCQQAIDAIVPWLNNDSLQSWTQRYALSDSTVDKTVGLVMAGNIPLVGFHDFLCVLISGHKCKVKLSSQDDELLPYLSSLLVSIDERWRGKFTFEDRLHNIDAVIATGSDNSARYFEYYFRNIPKIIRQNRTSVGVIMGEESQQAFASLGMDIFSYFGMGCRNVSKIYIPKGFDLNLLREPFNAYSEIINHNKYANNYDYQRCIRLVSNKPFIDFGNIILEESEDLVSPISVLYYQTYSNQEELNELLSLNSEKTQCVVSANGWLKESIPFGKAQLPRIDNYADNVDTLEFLARV